MTTNTPVAIDESADIMLSMAQTAYPAAVVLWTGGNSAPVDTDKSWFRWTFQHNTGEQASLSCEHGERRWRRNGLIIVQCFAPVKDGGLPLAQRMAESVRDAYQGQDTPGGVWFRNATTQEVGIDVGWYQVNAIIQFTYDEVR